MVRGPAACAPQRCKVTHRLAVAFVGTILLLNLALLALFLADWRFFSTRGDSMEPASSAGSLLIARLTAPKDIRANDFIVFPRTSQAFPLTAHRVDVVVEGGVQVVVMTKGDNNSIFDPEPVTLDRPVARVVLVTPWVGWFVTLKTAWFLLAIIALLVLRIASPWLAQRRITVVLNSHRR